MATVIHQTDLNRVAGEILTKLAHSDYFLTRMDEIAPADIEYEHHVAQHLYAYIYDQLCHSADVVFRETGCFRASTETVTGLPITEYVETRYLKDVMRDVSKHLSWDAIGREIPVLQPLPIIDVDGGTLHTPKTTTRHSIFKNIDRFLRDVAAMKPVKVEVEGEDFDI